MKKDRNTFSQVLINSPGGNVPMAMNGERELNRGHPVPASSTKRKEEDAGCVLGSDLKLVEVRARPPLTTPLPLKYPTPYAFPMAGVAETRKPPRLRGLLS